ncbi:DUF6744 family protein [Bacteroides sp.]|uniref:DUF6744 family protein n=1 Tax=Bacteroides sp. TaxID=29523 RepID=UPI002A30E0D1|nr:hypothetical protein [Bacteroides sp.]
MVESSLFSSENLIGIVGAPAEHIGTRFNYARKESEKGVRYDWLIPVLNELGLNGFAPNQPSPADSFRRACSDIPKGYIRDKEAKMKHKITMVLIDEAANPIVRDLQVTKVNQKGQSSTDGRLVARIQFDRETQGFSVRYGWQAGHDYTDCPDFVSERVEAAQEAYRKECDLVSDQQLAGMIRRILESCGITVRNIPSAWTIPATREETLKALVTLAERMNEEIEPDIFNVDTLPVVSTKKTRKKITADAVAFALSKLNKVLREEQNNIAFATDIEKQKSKSQGRFQSEAQSVMSIIEEYELLIGEAMDEVRQAREITERNLKTFCASPSKQATFKANVEEKRTGRKLRKNEVTPIYDGGKENTEPATPARRFNMGAADQVAAAM